MLCGAVAASAMIVPGISGSFILILLGVYWTVLAALSSLSGIMVESLSGFVQEGGFSVLLEKFIRICFSCQVV